MTFLHPAFLYGLAGVSIPVLIHFLARRRARRVLFPSLRLLKAAEKKRRRLSRLRRPLSLLLRCLAIALLALGLSAPVVGPLPGWIPLPRPQAIVIVLDDSLSMSGAGEGQSPFSRGREIALELVAALGRAEQVAVVPTSAPEEATWRSPSVAREWLSGRQPTALSARLAPAIAAAADALERTDAPNRSVVILTDFQAAAWREPPVTGEGLAGAKVMVVDVGSPRAQNTCVDALDLLTTAPLLGRPVRLSALARTSFVGKPAQGPRKVVFQLIVDDEPAAASEQVLTPDSPAAAQFSLLPDAPGDLPVEVALAGGPHGISLDDVRYRTVRVRGSLRVLAAAPGGAGTRPGSRLSVALNPFDDPTKAGIAPQVVQPAELAAAMQGEPPDVVVLADCPRVDRETQNALKSHLDAGGGLLIFLGDDIEPGFYAKQLLPDLVAGADVTFGAVVKAQGGAPFFLSEISTSREPLSPFANPRAGDLGALRFTRAQTLEPGPEADVLARFDNGVPALIHWRPRPGRVILFNTSADDSWGEHTRSPAYVPLLHRLCSYLARPARPAIADITVGERPAISAVDVPPGEVSVLDPRGQEQVQTVEDGLLPRVNEPGAYRIRWADIDIGFAANTDKAESDLTRTDVDSVRKALEPAEVTFPPPDAGSARIKARLPALADLSWPLLSLALAIFLFESVFSVIRREPAQPGSSRPGLVGRR